MGLFGGSEAAKVKYEPWGPAESNLKKSVDYTGRTADAAMANQFHGDVYADPTGMQRAALQRTSDFAGGNAQQLANANVRGALAMGGAGVNYGANADQIFSQYGGQATGGILDRTGQYLNNDVLNNQIAAMRANAGRDVAEQLAPMNGSFAANGNTNSSRAGVAEGIVRRAGNESANAQEAAMRGAAYNNAISAAQNDYFQGANTALAANAQVGNAFDVGQNATENAIRVGQQPNDMLMGVGNQNQQWNQQELDAARAQWQQQYLQGFDIMDRSTGILNGLAGNGGSQASGGGGGGMLGKAIGLGALAAGAYFAPATGGASLAAGTAVASQTA